MKNLLNKLAEQGEKCYREERQRPGEENTEEPEGLREGRREREVRGKAHLPLSLKILEKIFPLRDCEHNLGDQTLCCSRTVLDFQEEVDTDAPFP